MSQPSTVVVNQQYPVVYDPVANVHSPMVVTDVLVPSIIPLSARSQNVLQSLSDGLYVGAGLANATYYVSSLSGTDSPTSGSITTPYASIDYALAQVSSSSTGFTGVVAIELKSNESFIMNNDFIISNGQLSIGFYAEPTYGSTLTLVPNTGAYAWSVNNVLKRPTLSNVSVLVNGYWNSSKFLLRNNGRLTLRGLNIQLPSSPTTNTPASSYGMFTDLISVEDQQRGLASIEGCIVNKNDVTSFYGLVGVQARTENLTFSQFASQLQIASTLVTTGATTQVLISRSSFFKFYADYSGSNQSVGSLIPSTINSSPGSGMLKLNWSDVSTQSITSSVSNLATYPVLSDSKFGLANYFTGMIRDQQSRPLNVLSGRLL